jgi:ABC-type multidrug transport system fused ATPase/permease subunit
VLNDVSIEIRPGERVALMGPSGEGKTTLLRLVLGFVSPNKGRVGLAVGADGILVEAGREARRYITYVPQSSVLFTGSIRENLIWGNPDAGEKEMEDALKMAGAIDFVSALPDGMDTFVGEDGIGLSEGQVQRITIARALLRNAPILLLDEATSALDADTEALILGNLARNLGGRSMVVVSHRESVARYCGRVIRIEDGCIKETEGAMLKGMVGAV